MSQTNKISLFSFIVLALLAFGLIIPTGAQASDRSERGERMQKGREVHASSTKKIEDKMASSSKQMGKKMGDKMASSSKERGGKMSSSTPKVNAACMQTAVTDREESITRAWTTFTSAILVALEDRSEELYTAWGMSDSKTRGAAIKETADAWKSANKKAHETLRKSRNSAWETFKKTAKDSCKMPVPKEEALGTEAKDSIQI